MNHIHRSLLPRIAPKKGEPSDHSFADEDAASESDSILSAETLVLGETPKETKHGKKRDDEKAKQGEKGEEETKNPSQLQLEPPADSGVKTKP